MRHRSADTSPALTRRRLPILLALATLIASSLLVVGQASPQGAEEGFKVVVHPENPLDEISRQTLAAIFLKRERRWPDRVDVEAVNQRAESAVRTAFSQAVHGRPTNAIEAYWQQRIFTGREVPPPALGSDGEVVAFVRSRRGAVGYVSRRAATTGVKVIAVVD